ncbi:MAG: alpha/beta hydrolase [Pseudomonadota bacterium]
MTRDRQQPLSQEKMIRAGGHQLFVRCLGESPPERPTLVFLHEGLGSVAQWRAFPQALCEVSGLSGIVYDPWGFGRSERLVLPRPLDYLQQEATGALRDLLIGLQVHRPILIGHSDGGTIALLYAALYPDHPLCCITAAAHVIVEDITLQGIEQALVQWQEGDLRELLTRYHGDGTEAMFRGWAETWLRPEFSDWNMLDDLKHIACPVLALQGREDQYGTVKQLELIKGLAGGPVEFELIAHCGHAPHREARETTLALMEKFIKSQIPD